MSERKRTREDDEEVESLPLSKRINCLHLDNSSTSVEIRQTCLEVNQVPANHGEQSASCHDQLWHSDATVSPLHPPANSSLICQSSSNGYSLHQLSATLPGIQYSNECSAQSIQYSNGCCIAQSIQYSNSCSAQSMQSVQYSDGCCSAQTIQYSNGCSAQSMQQFSNGCSVQSSRACHCVGTYPADGVLHPGTDKRRHTVDDTETSMASFNSGPAVTATNSGSGGGHYRTAEILQSAEHSGGHDASTHLIDDDEVYNPELDARTNPEYYHINSVLFDAHQQRAHRYGQLFFHTYSECDNNSAGNI